MDAKLKQVKFEDIGINGTFVVQYKTFTKWCSKIDDSRYIHIGENGSHHPEETDEFFIEITE